MRRPPRDRRHQDPAGHRHLHRHRPGHRRRAAAAGWQVVATMRDPARDDALPRRGARRRCRPGRAAARRHRCRIRSRPASPTSRERYGRLDAVVNNAGISNFDPTMEMSTLDALRANLEVNFVGVVAVSRLAMPLLRREPRPAGHHRQRARRRRPAVQRGVRRGEVRRRGLHGEPGPGGRRPRRRGVGRRTRASSPTPSSGASPTSTGSRSRPTPGRTPTPSPTTSRGSAAEGWEGAAQSRWEVADVVVDTLDRPAPAFRVPTSAWVRDYLAHKLADVDGTDSRPWPAPGSAHPTPRLLSATADQPPTKP